MIDRGIIKPAGRAALAAVRVGQLSLARRLIARHLSNAELSPAFVADLLGVSLRHLHGLFEASGTSFSRAVTAQRLKQSRRLLIEAPERPVSQIALACGFDSLATFYRAFQTAHGMPPAISGAAPRRGSQAPRPLVFEGEMTESPAYLCENIKLFRSLCGSKIDFGHFDPMFADQCGPGSKHDSLGLAARLRNQSP